MNQNDLIEIIDILKEVNKKKENKYKLRELLKKLYKLQREAVLKVLK